MERIETGGLDNGIYPLEFTKCSCGRDLLPLRNVMVCPNCLYIAYKLKCDAMANILEEHRLNCNKINKSWNDLPPGLAKYIRDFCYSECGNCDPLDGTNGEFCYIKQTNIEDLTPDQIVYCKKFVPPMGEDL